MNKIAQKAQVNPDEVIKQRIFVIRGQKVMLDSDLAELYGILTKNFNKAVKRNINRFPSDFMFQLSSEEYESLRFQFGTSKMGRGGRRYLPTAFTEHGVAMLSSVLNSQRAIEMNIFIIRAFIKMRESLDNYKDLSLKIGEIELKQKDQGVLLVQVHTAVKDLMKKTLIA
jgi:hypothetical protein